MVFIVLPVLFRRNFPKFEIITSGGQVAGESVRDPSLDELYPFKGQPQNLGNLGLVSDPEAEKILFAINAQSAVVADLQTGKVLFAKAPHDQLPLASLTKIFTAVTAIENIALDTSFPVSAQAAGQQPHRFGVREGERYNLKELLYGLFLTSGNDAAEVIAEGAPGGRQRFIEAMNKKVEQLGLKETRLQNPSGLDGEQHFSSAWDVATTMRYAYLSHPQLREIMGTRDYNVAGDGHRNFWITHISEFIRENPSVKAVKTGYTENAGYCWTAIVERGGRGIVIAFLNSWQAKEDAAKLAQKFLP